MTIGSAGFFLPADSRKCPRQSSRIQTFFVVFFVVSWVDDLFATSRIQQKMPKTLLHKLSRLAIVNAKAQANPYTLSDGGRLYIRAIWAAWADANQTVESAGGR